MPKPGKKDNKRKKGSSTDDDTINISKKYISGGPARDHGSCPSVSAILNEANSILYNIDNSVFDDSIHDSVQANALSGLNMASNSSDVSSPSNADLYALLQSISTKLGHMEKIRNAYSFGAKSRHF